MLQSSIEELTVQSGDVDLAVYIQGNPAGPTLVLIHGYPDDHTVWNGVIESLAADFRIVTYDTRGNGKSAIPASTRDFRIEYLAEDLAEVIDVVSPVKPVHLVAHDWGSIQTWESVCTRRLEGRIASFTSMSGPSLDHAAYWLRDRLKHPTPSNLLEVAGQLLRSWYVMIFHLPLLAPILWRVAGNGWPRLLGLLEGIEAEARPTQIRDGIRGIKLYRANFIDRILKPRERMAHAPVQILVPVKDPFVSPNIANDLKKWVPQLWRRDVQLGHWMPLRNPGLFAQYVREFVEFNEQGQSGPLEKKMARHVVKESGKHKILAGRLAVITGAGNGIGRATALALAEEGASIIVADIDIEAAERTAEMVRLNDVYAWTQTVDVGNPEAMEAFAAWVENEIDTPDIVVNNAGIAMAGKFLDTRAEDWERLMRINVFGVIDGSRLFGQQMANAGKGGHIINVASAAAYSPTKLLAAYATTKASVRMLNDCIRAELIEHGIHVSTICPGIVDTGITLATKFVGVDEKEQNRLRLASKKLYQRRNLKPEAVARAIVKAIKHNRHEVPVGVEAHLLRGLYQHTHWLARRLARIDMTP